jgi:ribosomal protein S18 acetylase RimI-like enzyme
MTVRPMKEGDLDAVVAIHLAAFPSFFLTFLGPRFLRVFYGAVMCDGIALVAAGNDRVAGFVVGMLDSKSFYRRLLRKRFLQVAFAIVPAVLRHPSTLLRVIRRARQRTSEESNGAELMSLAVDPREQHRGAGRALVEAFAARALEAGAGSLWLITDAADNDAVKTFYRSVGFTRRRSFTNAEGRALEEYAR